MYSLVTLCCESYGFGDSGHCVVSGFATEAIAYEYAVRLLIEAGHVTQEGATYVISGDTEVCETAHDVVEAWADGLGLSEYFHVVEERPSKAAS